MENAKRRDQFLLKLPTGLRERIKEAAAREQRSMNAEIVRHLIWIYGPRYHDPRI
jgi:hypothetical protein